MYQFEGTAAERGTLANVRWQTAKTCACFHSPQALAHAQLHPPRSIQDIIVIHEVEGRRVAPVSEGQAIADGCQRHDRLRRAGHSLQRKDGRDGHNQSNHGRKASRRGPGNPCTGQQANRNSLPLELLIARTAMRSPIRSDTASGKTCRCQLHPVKPDRDLRPRPLCQGTSFPHRTPIFLRPSRTRAISLFSTSSLASTSACEPRVRELALSRCAPTSPNLHEHVTHLALPLPPCLPGSSRGHLRVLGLQSAFLHGEPQELALQRIDVTRCVGTSALGGGASRLRKGPGGGCRVQGTEDVRGPYSRPAGGRCWSNVSAAAEDDTPMQRATTRITFPSAREAGRARTAQRPWTPLGGSTDSVACWRPVSLPPDRPLSPRVLGGQQSLEIRRDAQARARLPRRRLAAEGGTGQAPVAHAPL